MINNIINLKYGTYLNNLNNFKNQDLNKRWLRGKLEVGKHDYSVTRCHSLSGIFSFLRYVSFFCPTFIKLHDIYCLIVFI